MKKIVLILFVLFVLKTNAQKQDTISTNWPAKTTGLSVLITTVPRMFTPINFSYDYLTYKKGVHAGYTTGLTTTFYEGGEYSTLGAHFTLTVMSGKGNDHIEFKIGGVINPIKLWSNNWDTFAFIAVPVISLGYRYQKPEGGTFYRVAISTGGIGVGIGTTLKKVTFKP